MRAAAPKTSAAVLSKVGAASEEVVLDDGHQADDNRSPLTGRCQLGQDRGLADPQFTRFDDRGAVELAAGVSGRPLFGEGAMPSLIEFEPGSVVALRSHEHEQLGIVLDLFCPVREDSRARRAAEA